MDAKPLTRWLGWAAVAVAFVAALALAGTVLVARTEFESASEAMVTGEGNSLVARLHESAAAHGGPPSKAQLEGQLAQLRPSGLRFVALENAFGKLAAGESKIPHEGMRPGSLSVRDGRALLVTVMPGPPGAPPPLPDGEARPARPPAARGAPAMLVIEFEPLVISRLSTGMNKTLAVGSGAVIVLMAFTAALTKRALERTSLERKAEQARRLAMLGQMAGVMAHELRNPLASLKGNAQLLEELLGVGTRERERAELVVRESIRLERLTQDLLAFVRDSAPSPRDVSTAEVLDRALIDVPRARIVLEDDGAPDTLYVDPVRLSVAIGNLVQNALQATGLEEPVFVRVTATEASQTDLSIEVRDEGPGVRPGEEERIFEPFFTTRTHGTGLGLFVARRAVEEHGGTLVAVASEGGGGVFRITLPGAARSPRAPEV